MNLESRKYEKRTGCVMTVIELMDLLRDADPAAIVMLLPHGSAESDAQEVRGFFPSDVRWTHESGVDKGRAYEFLYPGEPHVGLRTEYEQISYKSVAAVLLAADQRILG
jgi:hypothetical protein